MLKVLLPGLLFFVAVWILALYFLTTPIFGQIPARKLNVLPQEDTLKKHVQVLCNSTLPRNHQYPEVLDSVARYIYQCFQNYGYAPSEQVYKVKDNAYRNVIASYGPDTLETLVVGAHYDVCEHQAGADDNASGVAGLLELARLLALEKPKLPYRIEFVAFTLEEPPYFRTPNMGSAVHARSLVERKVKVKAMICLEMIGYFTDAPKSQEYPVGLLKAIYPSVGNYIAVVGRMGENHLVRKMKMAMRSVSWLPVESINAPASMAGIDFSDHQNYWKLGISAVMVTDTSFYRNKNYHQVTDTIDTLDFKRMNEVVKGVYQALMSLN